MTKSHSLTALPGSASTPSTNSAQHSYFGSFSSLHQIPHHNLGMGAVRDCEGMYPQPWKTEDIVVGHPLAIIEPLAGAVCHTSCLSMEVLKRNIAASLR